MAADETAAAKWAEAYATVEYKLGRGTDPDAVAKQLAANSELKMTAEEAERCVREVEAAREEAAGRSALREAKEAEAAKAAAAERAEASALKIVTARFAIENPRPPVLGLWGDWLVPGEPSGVIARGGVGKTTFTRNLMLQSARGEGEFIGKAFHAGPVRWLYCTREGSGGWWLESLHGTAEALGIDGDVLDRISLCNWADDCGLYLTTGADVDRLRDTLGQLRADAADGPLAVAFDPFTDFKAGSDQDDEAVQAAFASIKAICTEFKVAAWVPHHSSQGGVGLDAARGSTKYEGTVAAQLNLTAGVKDSNGHTLPETVRKLKIEKNRYGRKTTHYLDFDEDTEVYSERPKPGVASDTVGALRDAGEAGFSIAEIVGVTGASDSATRDSVKALEGEGKAEVVDPDARPARHRLTGTGISSAGLGV